MSGSKVIQSVVTTLSVIEIMAEARAPMGVSELARKIGITKPRIFRHLRTLLDRGYVEQDPINEKYQLTLKIFHLGQLVFENIDFLHEARRVLPNLVANIKQTITIGQVEDSGIRIMDILKYRSDIEITTPPGSLLGFHSSAQGKVALAFGPNFLWEKVSKASLPKITPKTITDLESLRDEIEKIKRRGWSEAPEQSLIGVNALAAPVLDKDGGLAGIITAVGSATFLRPQEDKDLRQELISTANEISQKLGYVHNR
jgi:DNA-binding IclR family transcriptional regulator